MKRDDRKCLLKSMNVFSFLDSAHPCEVVQQVIEKLR